MNETYIIIGLVLFTLLVLIILKEYFDYKKRIRRAIELSKQAFGKFSSKRLSLDELENVKKMFYRYIDEDAVDDITASDLSIDEIYEKLDVSLSAPGKQYFYYLLRNPKTNEKELNTLSGKVDYFENNVDECHSLRAHFLKIGQMFKITFFDYLDLFENAGNKHLVKEFLVIIALFLGIGIIFVSVPIGVAVLIAAVCYNIIDYFGERGEIEAYLIALSYIINFIKETNEIAKEDIPVLKEELSELNNLYRELKPITKNSYLVLARNKDLGAGNPVDMLLDYLRMLLHLDIICFYLMVDRICANKNKLEKLYFLLGKVESYVTIASVRKCFPRHCIPKTSVGINAVNIYHPLVENPVSNSISAEKGVLITGSNASGKSTFLKTIAVNYLFSKTMALALADEFSSDFYHIFSSMSLRDDIISKDSYFMVEIKALKRIFDYKQSNPDTKILCFVDEVLRGTNTIERIAACTQILRNLVEQDILCFAATHDYELTSLLSDYYDNYHFDEDIVGDDVIFSYVIKEGMATSRNAIKLLSIMGFDKDVVSRAKEMADEFVSSGIWRG